MTTQAIHKAGRLPDPAFWQGRRVLLTGHTGFKGAWMSLLLHRLGAKVTGLALLPREEPSLFAILGDRTGTEHHIADLREPAAIAHAVRTARPSIVLHLAAQALVPAGYEDPAGTFAINCDGTINVLQAMRGVDGIEAALLVTTDKVYRNRNDGRRFAEDDPLGGEDPYSASKAAAEIAIASWRASFTRELPRLVVARAGNVIGGGDFSTSRLVPDIVRSVARGETLMLRHPGATRPWQHVLDVAIGYLLQVEHAVANSDFPHALNFGPIEPDEISVRDLVVGFERAFGLILTQGLVGNAKPEATRLALDPTLACTTLGWAPRFDRQATIDATAAWYAAWTRGEDVAARTIAEAEHALSPH